MADNKKYVELIWARKYGKYEKEGKLEKLGRRWIGCDLSKFAIQVTRKRLLDIHRSKDSLDEKGKNKYEKPARPFEIWNIGNYETVYWQKREDEYLAFMLKLYQSQPLKGFRYLYGRKGGRVVHIGPLNAPVTIEEVEKVVIECRSNNFNKVDVLGWEWSYEVNELVEIASKVKDSRQLIDCWAIDWDYKGDTFHNQWQSFRVKKNPKVDYEARHTYNESGEYQIMVKVVDVFGNDTNKVMGINA